MRILFLGDIVGAPGMEMVRTALPALIPAERLDLVIANAENPARDGTPVAVFSVLGRTFMRPVDCPFRAADRVLAEIGARARVIVVDCHAEATADKYLLGHHLKG